MKTLNIAKDLKLPLDAVTQTFAIMAKRGVGKTHTASVMAEEMLKHGQPVIVYDPTSAWWGLKSSADGKEPGYPVVIFGGEHADVPLEENAGEMIATVIVERRLSAILDCGLMRKGARIRFMTAFCEALYHKNREPIHFFIDEAQTVAPQNLKAMPEIARLVGALEDIILQGRRRGLGVTVISPRPAILNTSIRSACEVLIAMQIVGPHDRKAIQDWIDVHGDDVEAAREMMATLSSLKRGEAWVWSPAWLEIFVRTKFRRRETFDSSATPEIGNRVVAPSRMADIDLAKLGKEIAATVERVKADDPKTLRVEIAKLQHELTLAKQAVPKVPAVKITRVEVPALKKGEIKQLKQFLQIIENATKSMTNGRYTLESAIGNAETIAKEISSVIQNSMKGVTAIGASGKDAHTRPPTGVAIAPIPQRKVEAGNGADLPGPQQRILDAVAWFESIGITEPETTAVAFIAGYTVGGGAFNNPRGSLRTAGLIEYRGSKFALTDSGRSVARMPGYPPTQKELHDRVLQLLPGPEQKLLRVLIDIYPNDIGDADLAERAGYSAGGGAFNNPKGRLRTLGLATYPAARRIRAADLLFIE